MPEDFDLVEAAIPQVPAAGIVVRNHYASLDPAQRGWMDDAESYMPPIQLHGFLIADYADRVGEGGAQMAQWMAQGKLRIDEDIQFGLENAYSAFMRLFTGANTGKLVLKIARSSKRGGRRPLTNCRPLHQYLTRSSERNATSTYPKEG